MSGSSFWIDVGKNAPNLKENSNLLLRLYHLQIGKITLYMVLRYETQHFHRSEPISINLLQMLQVPLLQSSVEIEVQLPCLLAEN